MIDTSCPFYKSLHSVGNFTDQELEEVLSYFKRKRIKKNRFVLQEGNLCLADYFVVKGLLRKFHESDGKEHTTQFACEGCWISDWAAQASGLPSEFNIEALEETVVLIISTADIQRLIAKSRKFESYYREEIKRGHILQEKRILCMQKQAQQCYADFESMYGGLETRVSQTHIASFIGISRESLSRLKNNAIKKIRNRDRKLDDSITQEHVNEERLGSLSETQMVQAS